MGCLAMVQMALVRVRCICKKGLTLEVLHAAMLQLVR